MIQLIVTFCNFPNTPKNASRSWVTFGTGTWMVKSWWEDINWLLQENLQSGFVWDRMDYNSETGNLTLWLLNFTCESFQVPAATAFILFPDICLHQQRWKINFWDGKQPREEPNTPTNQMTEWWLAHSIYRLM